MSRSVFQRYTFVDYASQAYSALVALAIVLFHNDSVAHWPWLVAAHGFGILTVHWMVHSSDSLWRKPRDRELGRGALTPSEGERENVRPSCSEGRPVGRHGRGVMRKVLSFLRHFYPVLLYIWFYSETGWLNRMFFRTYLDPFVIRSDQALFGYQPSILWMQKLPYLAMSEVFYAAYFSYYLMIFGVGLALYLRNRQQFFHYISILSFVFYICYAFYIAVPVIGPVTLLHLVPGYNLPPDIQALAPDANFPQVVRSGVFYRVMNWIYEVFEAPGAAIPSSHVAIALCIVYFCFRYLRAVRFVLLVMAALLCLSTVYCRYHYVTDVLAGIATALVLLPLGNGLYFKLEQHDLVAQPQQTMQLTTDELGRRPT